MKIKQMAEEIRKSMPKDLDELETLRYIYIYLGKRKSFDPAYFFGNRKTREKIYTLNSKKIEDREYLASNKQLICTSIAGILRLLGKEFDIGIECMQDEFYMGAHMHNMAILKDGRNVHLDLQQDLRFIHTGKKTIKFGSDRDMCDVIDENTLEKVDEKIGYKEPGKPYKGEIMLDVIQRILENEEDPVRELLNNEEFNNEIQSSNGYVEQVELVEDYLLALGAYNADVITCYRDEDVYKQQLPERQYSMCVFANGIDIYMFKQKEKRFVEISLQRMSRLIEQGLKFANSYAKKQLENLLFTYNKRKNDKEL